MLRFPEDFFQEETRNGFTIEPMMKRAWAAQMEVLWKVSEACEEENIRWFPFWGTLLGIVRHGGFIPWDDDIDIAMPREDYMKFLSAAGKHLPEEYRILDVYHEREWVQSFARVVNGKTIDVSDRRLKEFHGCPFAVGIDIFPLDEWEEDETNRENRQSVLDILRGVADALLAAGKADTAEKQEILRAAMEGVEAVEEAFGIQIDREQNLLNQLCRFYDQVCMQKYTPAENELPESAYTCFDISWGKSGYRLDKKWFDGTEVFPFENISVSIPVGYQEILTELYGDFMTPDRTAASHSYPFYKDQLEELRRKRPDLGY